MELRGEGGENPLSPCESLSRLLPSCMGVGVILKAHSHHRRVEKLKSYGFTINTCATRILNNQLATLSTELLIVDC